MSFGKHATHMSNIVDHMDLPYFHAGLTFHILLTIGSHSVSNILLFTYVFIQNNLMLKYFFNKYI